jgi:hypothetical protein
MFNAGMVDQVGDSRWTVLLADADAKELFV